MVEVFKTNVGDAKQADVLVALLLRHIAGSKVTFDLEDCDKVLRIEASEVCVQTISGLLQARNYICEVME